MSSSTSHIVSGSVPSPTLEGPKVYSPPPGQESVAMSTAEHIYNEVRSLPESQAREVLDFVAFLKTRYARANSSQQDMSVFDRFGSVYEVRVNRDELYDRKVLR